MFNDAKETLRQEDTLGGGDLDPRLGNSNHMSHSPAFCSETGRIYSLLLTHMQTHRHQGKKGETRGARAGEKEEKAKIRQRWSRRKMRRGWRVGLDRERWACEGEKHTCRRLIGDFKAALEKNSHLVDFLATHQKITHFAVESQWFSCIITD